MQAVGGAAGGGEGGRRDGLSSVGGAIGYLQAEPELSMIDMISFFTCDLVWWEPLRLCGRVEERLREEERRRGGRRVTWGWRGAGVEGSPRSWRWRRSGGPGWEEAGGEEGGQDTFSSGERVRRKCLLRLEDTRWGPVVRLLEG